MRGLVVSARATGMSSSALAELLERRRPALEALPGVVGTAIGHGADTSAGERPAIHVYVTPGTDAGHVRAEAGRLLGDAPVELVEMDVPEAQPD